MRKDFTKGALDETDSNWATCHKPISQNKVDNTCWDKDAIIRRATDQKFKHWLQEIRCELLRCHVSEYIIDVVVGGVERLLRNRRLP